jgi:hypothetical protein
VHFKRRFSDERAPPAGLCKSIPCSAIQEGTHRKTVSRFTCDCECILRRFEAMEKNERRFWWRPKSAILEGMDHLSIEVIERYALRELPADEIQRVEEHIAACPDCEDRLQDEVELPVAMRSSSVAGVRRIVESRRKNTAQR